MRELDSLREPFNGNRLETDDTETEFAMDLFRGMLDDEFTARKQEVNQDVIDFNRNLNRNNDGSYASIHRHELDLTINGMDGTRLDIEITKHIQEGDEDYATGYMVKIDEYDSTDRRRRGCVYEIGDIDDKNGVRRIDMRDDYVSRDADGIQLESDYSIDAWMMEDYDYENERLNFEQEKLMKLNYQLVSLDELKRLEQLLAETKPGSELFAEQLAENPILAKKVLHQSMSSIYEVFYAAYEDSFKERNHTGATQTYEIAYHWQKDGDMSEVVSMKYEISENYGTDMHQMSIRFESLQETPEGKYEEAGLKELVIEGDKAKLTDVDNDFETYLNEIELMRIADSIEVSYHNRSASARVSSVKE